MAFGGTIFPTTTLCTEEYNGSSWSAGGSFITGRDSLAGAGTQNAGLAFGGNNGSDLSCTEEYNGTSWSAGGALINARYRLAGAGTQNSGLAFGGSPTISCTEEYNGTSWSAASGLLLGRRFLGGAGTTSAGLAFGGYDGGSETPSTEEYNSSGLGCITL